MNLIRAMYALITSTRDTDETAGGGTSDAREAAGDMKQPGSTAIICQAPRANNRNAYRLIHKLRGQTGIQWPGEYGAPDRPERMRKDHIAKRHDTNYIVQTNAMHCIKHAN